MERDQVDSPRPHLNLGRTDLIQALRFEPRSAYVIKNASIVVMIPHRLWSDETRVSVPYARPKLLIIDVES